MSIALVFWDHSGFPFPMGQEGVTVFFFLSGFLITTLLRIEWDTTRTISVGSFYVRRFFRIAPDLIVVLAVAILLSALKILPSSMSLGAPRLRQPSSRTTGLSLREGLVYLAG